MKIATWNLERGGRTRRAMSAQHDLLRELGADVTALTEPPSSFKEALGVITSPARREGSDGIESWVAILGADIERIALDIPYERMAVAARAKVGAARVVVYCAVLPWLSVTSHAPYLVRSGETSLDVFQRVLNEQVEDVKTLRRDFGEPVIWAGDFNQTLEGSSRGGSDARRLLLQSALASLDYVAWNGAAAHACEGMCAVDLICGPRAHVILGQGRIDPVRDGIVMSDHAGYWIES